MSKKSNYTQELEVIRNEISRKKIKYTVPSLMPDIERIKLHLEIEALERIAKKLEALEIIKEKDYEKYMLEAFKDFEAYRKNAESVYKNQLVIDWNNEEQLVELKLYNKKEFELLMEVLENA